MKVYALIIDSRSLDPVISEYDVDNHLSGRELLWEVDDLDLGDVTDHENYEPIRFVEYKETSFGVVGYGPYKGKALSMFMAVSTRRQPISILSDEWDEFSSKTDHYYSHGALKLFKDFYEDIS